MTEQLTFIDMFAGIGGFRSGMEQAGHKCVGFIEWDKYARQSYQAMYNTEGEFNAKDIQSVSGTDLPDANVWCFGSPCQDISVAGKQAGLEKGSRSSMFFEVIRLLKERAENQKTIPAYLLMENVKNLLSSNGGWDFARVQIEMDKAGYDVEWNVFNSAEVVPQNRERIYIVGHLRGASTRKVFPIQRQGRYAGEEQSIKVMGNTSNTQHNSERVIDANGLSPTVTASQYKHPIQVQVKQVGNIRKTNSFGGNPQTGRVYSTDGLSPTLNTMQGGGREPKILVKPVLTPDRISKKQNGRRFKNDGEPSFTITSVDRQGVAFEKLEPKEQFGRLGQQAVDTYNENISNIKSGDIIEPYNHRLHKNGKTPTVTTRPEGLKTAIVPVTDNLRIRKLTPLECWRLQGFSDEQFYKAKQSGVSNSQLYKQAGNAVTVPVVKAVAEQFSLSDIDEVF